MRYSLCEGALLTTIDVKIVDLENKKNVQKPVFYENNKYVKKL